MDPFLLSDVDNENLCQALGPDLSSYGEVLTCVYNSSANAVTIAICILNSFLPVFFHDLILRYINININRSNTGSKNNMLAELELPSLPGRDFTVEGQRKDINTIFLKLRIADSTGLHALFLYHL